MLPGPIHLIKLCVGIGSVSELANHQYEGVQSGRYAQPEHRTRHRPQRWEELVAGGSIYWVINGIISARQRITAIEQLKSAQGGKGCTLIFSPTLYLTYQYPMRPFRGWRYLAVADAPPDVGRLERRTDPDSGQLKGKPGHQW